MKTLFQAIAVVFLLAGCQEKTHQPEVVLKSQIIQSLDASLAKLRNSFRPQLSPKLEAEFSEKLIESQNREALQQLASFQSFAFVSSDWREAKAKYEALVEASEYTNIKPYIQQVASACYLNVLTKDAASPSEEIAGMIQELYSTDYRGAFLIAKGLVRIPKGKSTLDTDKIKGHYLAIADKPYNNPNKMQALQSTGEEHPETKLVQQKLEAVNREMISQFEQERIQALRILSSL